MKEEEIRESYEYLKTTADKALEDAAARSRRVDIIEEIVGFVFTVLLAFGWMMLVLLLISFVGLAYVHFEIAQMLVWSVMFALVIAVIEALGLIRKHRNR